MSVDTLPSSRLDSEINVVSGWHPLLKAFINYVPIFCANCGFDSGMLVPEDSGFAFYLCDERGKNCADRWEPLANTCLVPDEIFWQKVKEAQLEEYGRELTPEEIIEA